MANINESKKYHFIYKTTNLLNGKYYVGIHSTSNLKDGYLGSGKRLRYSIRKYGESNFKCEILEFFNSREELVRREKELVNEDLIKDFNCLNLKPGGEGGLCDEKHLLKLREGASNYQKQLRKDPEYLTQMVERLRKGVIEARSRGAYKNVNYATFKGKSHSEEVKQVISNKKKGLGTGESNSQFGSKWITDGTNSKKVKNDSDIPAGWYKGRKIKTRYG